MDSKKESKCLVIIFGILICEINISVENEKEIITVYKILFLPSEVFDIVRDVRDVHDLNTQSIIIPIREHTV